MPTDQLRKLSRRTFKTDDRRGKPGRQADAELLNDEVLESDDEIG